MGPPAKRRKVEPVAEVTFDPAARQEYLTGFHKRKLQRIKHAQETAQKREREEKVQQRKEVRISPGLFGKKRDVDDLQIRDERKRDLEKHVAEVNALLKKQIDSSAEEDFEDEDAKDDDWAGFEDIPTLDGTDEYIDEGKYTTVTIKELDDVRDFESQSEDEDGEAKTTDNSDKAATTEPGRRKKSQQGGKPKQKKKKFRYESKLDRQADRKKLKAKRVAAAKARREG